MKRGRKLTKMRELEYETKETKVKPTSSKVPTEQSAPVHLSEQLQYPEVRLHIKAIRWLVTPLLFYLFILFYFTYLFLF